ncbi:MAG TPA: LytR C-terminal domain-containing protein [Microbacteriaceae bacterium]|nr:LytR C-terminal domain-containing protein [Microbacteriaceae bacterium]
MVEKFPTDRFDDLSEQSGRVGAHRPAPRPFARFVFAMWALLAVVLLSGVGIGAVVVIDNGIFSSADDSNSAMKPTVSPTVDPSVPVTVFNGTPTEGLEQSASDELTAAGFVIEASAAADKNDIVESAVYYTSPTYEGVARGVAEALGIGKVAQSAAFTSIGSNLTVVLGTDFVPSPVG